MDSEQRGGGGIEPVPRRRMLALGGGLALAGVAAACGTGSAGASGGMIGPDSPQVAAFAAGQRRRYPHGRTVRHTLTAAAGTVDTGGGTCDAWTYDGELPGPVLRGTVGDRLRVRLRNRLGEPSTIHWHGLAIGNDMDGVPGVTQPAVPAGHDFTYDFVLPQPGTYWYHSHGKLQRGRGLYGALLIDDPHEPGDHDVEYTVLLADWLTHRSPRQVLSDLERGDMGGMPSSGSMPGSASGDEPSGHGRGMAGMSSRLLGGESGDVRYPVYLLNGRGPSAPVTVAGKSGRRARIRLVNAAEDTTFRVALGGHRLTVTHSDGFPVTPVTGDAVLLGQGERYDVVTTLADGVFPLVAMAEGKHDRAFALVRTASGAAPAATVAPAELSGRVLTVADLHSPESVRLSGRAPQNTLRARIGGGMRPYVWTLNGRAYPRHTPLVVHPGQRVRLSYTNPTGMYHPMHLHGHTFQVARPDGSGPRKDTVIVLPGQTVHADFDADNPGQWFTHCHNEYHLAAGLATVVSYRS